MSSARHELATHRMRLGHAPCEYCLTCTTTMKLQIVSMPRLPSTSRKSWPIGNGRFDVRSEETDDVAKDAETRTSHPRISVLATPRMMAIGALRCASATSSEMCAAESSDTTSETASNQSDDLQPVSVHMGAVKANKNAQPSVMMSETCPLTVQHNILLVQPTLFSNNVNASFADTLLSPEHTSKATMAATVVPPLPNLHY